MRSLFVRIWLTFWAVMVVTFLVALAVSFALAINRAQSIDRLSPRALAQEAGRAMATGGDDGLREWILRTHNDYPELEVFVVDPKGRELRGRSPAEVRRAFAVAADPGKTFPAVETLNRPEGLYRFAFRRTSSLAFDLWDILLEPGILILAITSISGLGAAMLAHNLSSPVVKLRSGVRTLASGNLDVAMEKSLARRRDELGALAREFDQMAARLRDLIASKEALLRDVSHELRSPLARLRIASDAGRRASASTARDYDAIDREVARLDALIGEILSFSRLGHGAVCLTNRVDLAALVEAAVEDARFEGAPQNKSLLLEHSETPPLVAGDATLLRSAVDNVLRNALHFSPKNSSIALRVAGDGDQAHIIVRDCGEGIAREEGEKIFEPFHRGSGSSGLGLGLAITKRIVELHAGTVRAVNVPSGFEIRLTFPGFRDP